MGKVFSKVLAAGSAIAGFTLLAAPVMAQSYMYDYGYTGADTAAGVAGLGFGVVYMLCICCVPLIISSVVAYLVFKDAKKHNIDNAAVWALLCFFFNVIGVLVYFLVPRAEAMKKKEGSSEKKAE